MLIFSPLTWIPFSVATTLEPAEIFMPFSKSMLSNAESISIESKAASKGSEEFTLFTKLLNSFVVGLSPNINPIGFCAVEPLISTSIYSA